MKLTIRQLRRLIEAGLDTDMRNMAGSCNPIGLSSGFRDKETSMMSAPPGLGDDFEDDDTGEDEMQKRNQLAPRVLDKRGERGR